MTAPTAENVFPVLVAVAGLAFGLVRTFAWGQVKGLAARGWMMVQGRIEFGSVTENPNNKNLYLARVDYSYSYNNEYYSGYLERTFVLERSADAFVDGMKGQMVFVRVNPSKPERSAMLEQDQPAGWPK